MFDSLSQSPDTMPRAESVSTLDRELDCDNRPLPPARPSSHLSKAPEETPKSIRWVRRILAVLILVCLAMAAWVWAAILHDLP